MKEVYHYVKSERESGYTLCGRAFRIGNIYGTNTKEEVTCKHCLRMLSEDKQPALWDFTSDNSG